jgi:hypothetical protein
MVVLRGGQPSRRWANVTRVHAGALRDLDPAAVLFIEFDPLRESFSLLHLRWSERLLSYCNCGITTLSATMAASLGLKTQHCRKIFAPSSRCSAASPVDC